MSHIPDIPEKQTVKGVEARNIILTFAHEKINTIESIPSPVSVKQGLRTTDYGLRTGYKTPD